MEEELLKLKKGNNRKKAIIAILLFVLVLSWLIVFIFFCDKKEDKPTNQNNQQEKTSDNEDTTLPQWVNYILKQNISKVGYDTENGWKDITRDQLKGYLKKLTTDYSLYKEKDYDGGCGGPYCGLDIEYGNKKITIYSGTIHFENYNGKEKDNELLALLEKEKYTIDNSESNYDTWHFAYYRGSRTEDATTLEIIDYIEGR